MLTSAVPMNCEGKYVKKLELNVSNVNSFSEAYSNTNRDKEIQQDIYTDIMGNASSDIVNTDTQENMAVLSNSSDLKIVNGCLSDASTEYYDSSTEHFDNNENLTLQKLTTNHSAVSTPNKNISALKLEKLNSSLIEKDGKTLNEKSELHINLDQNYSNFADSNLNISKSGVELIPTCLDKIHSCEAVVSSKNTNGILPQDNKSSEDLENLPIKSDLPLLNKENVELLDSLQNLSLDFSSEIKLYQESDNVIDILGNHEMSNANDLEKCIKLDKLSLDTQELLINGNFLDCEDIPQNQEFHKISSDSISQVCDSIQIQGLNVSQNPNLQQTWCKNNDKHEMGSGNSAPSEISNHGHKNYQKSNEKATCLCERPANLNVDSNRSVLIGAWNELRSSIRQIHRSVVPSPSSKLISAINSNSRPSINRIKALTNILLNHDPFQLFTRVHHLSQEFCIELKVRLLSTFHDAPDIKESLDFVKELCLAYELLMKVCEVIQSAFEKLDSDYLSQFNLSWTTINVHSFYSAIFTDPDVQDYLALCSSKIENDKLNGGLDCLDPLKTALSVAEDIWSKAETAIQEYAVERAALNVHRRQALAEWEFAKCTLPNAKPDSPNSAMMQGSTLNHNQMHGSVESKHGAQTTIFEETKVSPKSCECHYCNSSASKVSCETMLTSRSSALPPLAQPQLSLYPHIHGTTSKSDILTDQLMAEDIAGPPITGTKPSVLENPYLGSDLLTEQLIREWDMAYGDSLTGSGVAPPASPTSQASDGLDMKTLTINASDMEKSGSGCYSQQCGHGPCGGGTAAGSEDRTRTPPEPRSSSSSSLAAAHRGEASNVGSASNDSGVSCRTPVARSQLKNPVNVSSSQSSCGKACKNGPFDAASWSSADESDFDSESLSGHDDEHCGCCYCHVLQNKQGGRQRYQDRRDRLLKKLSEKKRNEQTHCNKLATSGPVEQSKCSKSDDKKSLDDILNFIEGKKLKEKCPKKAAKRARQKQRKRAALKREVDQRTRDSDSDEADRTTQTDDDDEEDGPLAELRRRAPDVTITVVKPGQQQQQQTTRHPHPSHPAPPQPKPKPNNINNLVGFGKDGGNAQAPNNRHPLANHPLNVPLSQTSDIWSQSRTILPSGQLAGVAPSPSEPKPTKGKSLSSTGGLSSLIKGIENLSKDQNGEKDGKSSKMVTIRRVMDPISSEPTVTITLKGEEPKKDKVLFKLVNGQACQGDAKGKKQAKKQKSAPQVKPVYNIPKGVTPEEAKKIQKQQKRERQRRQKEEEKRLKEEQENMKILEIQKQREFLKQQEEGIRKQKAALEKQQNELLRQQSSKVQNDKTKGKKTNAAKSQKSGKNNNRNNSAIVYEGDDVASNFTLPPGVSINKVAGQPGMVTISNNMANHFSSQPFLSNPNVYPPNVPGYHLDHTAHSRHHDSMCGQSHYPNMYPNPAISGIPWNNTMPSPSVKMESDNVIVVDTNTKPKKKENKVKKSKPVKEVVNKVKETKKPNVPAKKKKMSKETFARLTSDEKVDAALKDKVDPSWLNMTQKKKLRKQLRVIRMEEEKVSRVQREEDELMDRMYEISKNYDPRNLKAKKNEKVTKKPNNEAKKNTKIAANKQPQAASSKKSDSVSKNFDKPSHNIPNQPVTKRKNAPTETSKAGGNAVKKLPKNEIPPKDGNKKATSSTNNATQLKQNKLQLQKSTSNKDVKNQVSTKISNSANNHKEQNQKHVKVDAPQKSVPDKKNKQTSKQSNHPNVSKITPTAQSQPAFPSGSNHLATVSKMAYDNESFRPAIGYANNDYGHDVRYAQYLAANANALANIDYDSSGLNVQKLQHQNMENGLNAKNIKKKNKKGQVEDLTTIDSVFTPKEIPSGELDDETDREVEAFKRFCLYNVPRNTGQKPKVNFNVKDIMIKKKH